MTTNQTAERITLIICNDIAPDLQQENISIESSLFDDLKLDSIKLVEMLTQLETEFSVALDDEDMGFEHFATVGTLSEFIDDVIVRQSA